MIKLSVPDMSCGHCKAKVEETVAALDPLAEVKVDLDRRTVEIDAEIASDALLAALAESGYPATPV